MCPLQIQRLEKKGLDDAVDDVAAIQAFVVRHPDADFTDFWPTHKQSLPDAAKSLADVVFLAVGTSGPSSAWCSLRCSVGGVLCGRELGCEFSIEVLCGALRRRRCRRRRRW